MSQILDRVLTAARQLGASDVHLKAGMPPIFRIKGDLRTVRDVPALTGEAIASFAVHMMNDRQRGLVGMVIRLIPPEVPPFDRLNLSPTILELAGNARGVVLVTGATGSGK